MEIIIGREEGARRLHCVVGDKSFNLGQAGWVPMSVSRTHCKLAIDGEKIAITNIKPENITYVNGNQIFSKSISVTDKIELGSDKFAIPLQKILEVTGGTPKKEAPTFSLKPLESVWNEYEERKQKIQDEQKRIAALSRLQSVLSLGGMCVLAIPSIPPTVRNCCIAAALVLAVYFMYKSFKDDSMQKKITDLNKEFESKYKCPNPDCPRPFSVNTPYSHLIYNTRGCSHCGCKYSC